MANKEQTYIEKSLQKFKIILCDVDILKSIQNIRGKYGIPVKIDQKVGIVQLKTLYLNEKDAINYMFKHKKHLTYKDIEIKNNIFDEIQDLMEEYSIDSIYFEMLKYFINTGNLNTHFFKLVFDCPAFFVGHRNKEEGNEMYIRIFPETTQEDIIKEWKEICINRDKFLRTEVKRNNDVSLTVDLGLRALQLKISNYSSREIAKKLNEEFNLKSMVYVDVNKLLYRLKFLNKKKTNNTF